MNLCKPLAPLVRAELRRVTSAYDSLAGLGGGQAICGRAAMIGAAHGRDAARRALARATPATCHDLTTRLDAGDPMVYDLYPTPALSGQHGIHYGTLDLAGDLGLSPADDGALDAAGDAYFTAAGEAFWAEAGRIARDRAAQHPHASTQRGVCKVAGARDRFEGGDRVALEYTRDPHTRLRPGDEGTVTGYDPGPGQFSDCPAPFDASELVFYVDDMPVTSSGRRGGRII